MDAISTIQFDYVASGHYADVKHPFSESGASGLKLSCDMVKDQTYFLSHLSQDQLKRLLFPLGCIPKGELRRLATIMDLPNKNRKDSQGICFLGKVILNSEKLKRYSGPAGRCSSNEAEAPALLTGVKLLREQTAETVYLEGDSLMVINWAKIGKPPWKLRYIFEEIQFTLEGNNVIWCKIPRSTNSLADQ